MVLTKGKLRGAYRRWWITWW